MNPSTAKNERTKLKEDGAFKNRVIYGLIGTQVVLAGVVAWMVINQMVLVVPPEVKRPYELGANYANKDYLADQANYVLDKILTVTPESVEHNNRTILKMTDPDGYGQLKAELDAAAMRVRKDRISTVWVPRKETVLERDKVVRVSGSLKTYIADTHTGTRDKDFQVEFIITSSGRLYVSKVKEIVKSEPRSAAQQPG